VVYLLYACTVAQTNILYKFFAYFCSACFICNTLKCLISFLISETKCSSLARSELETQKDPIISRTENTSTEAAHQQGLGSTCNNVGKAVGNTITSTPMVPCNTITSTPMVPCSTITSTPLVPCNSITSTPLVPCNTITSTPLVPCNTVTSTTPLVSCSLVSENGEIKPKVEQ